MQTAQLQLHHALRVALSTRTRPLWLRHSHRSRARTVPALSLAASSLLLQPCFPTHAALL